MAVRIVVRPADFGRSRRDFARSQIIGRNDIGSLAHHDVVEVESRPTRITEAERIEVIVGCGQFGKTECKMM